MWVPSIEIQSKRTKLKQIVRDAEFDIICQLGKLCWTWPVIGQSQNSDIPNEKIRLPPLEVHFGIGGCGRTVSVGGAGQE